MPSIQTTTPPLTLVATQQQTLLVTPVTFPAGHSLSDFQAFTLTLRGDPNWPRQTAAAIQQAQVADPAGEGWPVVFTGNGTGTTVGSVSTVTFVIPSGAALPSGPNRLAAVVWGQSGTDGPVQLLPQTWTTVLPG